MKNFFKITYGILGIIVLISLIIWLILNIFGLNINKYYFTYNKEKCLQSGGRLKDILCAERPPFFYTKP
jgi:hypothetical protein